MIQRIGFAFTAPYDVTPDEARADVLRQMDEWAAAEPKVDGYTVIEATRPKPERMTWWEITADVEFEGQVDQLELAL